MIGSGLIMIIRDSARKGESAYAIGKEQNISKNTAKKYMQVGTLSEPSHKRGSILDPFKPQVNQMMHDGIFNLCRHPGELAANGLYRWETYH